MHVLPHSLRWMTHHHLGAPDHHHVVVEEGELSDHPRKKVPVDLGMEELAVSSPQRRQGPSHGEMDPAPPPLEEQMGHGPPLLPLMQGVQESARPLPPSADHPYSGVQPLRWTSDQETVSSPHG